VIKRLKQLLESEECAEFGMEVMARFQRFSQVLQALCMSDTQGKGESEVEFLFQSIEMALSAKEDLRRESQQLFIESQALEVAMKRLEDFKSLRFLLIALAAIRICC